MDEKKMSYYTKHLKADCKASLVVFLVAIPLCLGIALASGAPLFAGLISGIVGGLVVSWASGSQLSVAGPAAGLTVIVLGAIETLGSYPLFLVSVVLAGLLQIAMGYLKAGTLGAFFPSAVIKGMLAGIGLILIIKQIPHAFGYDVNFEGDDSYMLESSSSSWNTLMESFSAITWEISLLTVLSLIILWLWETERLKKFAIVRNVPAPLLVVMLGIFYTTIIGNIEPSHLVSIPEIESFQDFKNLFIFPDINALYNPQIYMIAMTLAIIASIETLLSLEAVDRLDPLKRVAPTNRELKAQGLGNIISGMIGGLPLTSVIVRSSVNVYNGGRTKVSAFLHGWWLVLSVLVMASLLNMIPLASLASILIYVGYKLASPQLFKEIYKQGWNQFLPFTITIVAILITDLLQGILIGMVVGLFFVIRTNYKKAISMKQEGKIYTITLHKDVTFLNKALLRKLFSKIEEGSHLKIDGSKVEFVDHDIWETIDDFIVTASDKNITVEKKLFVDI